MRTRVLLSILICGLLVACSDSALAPTPTALQATATPVGANDATAGAPGDLSDPPPESTSSAPPTGSARSTPAQTVATSGTPAPLPAGPLTLVALGDSLTEGDGDQPGE